MSRRQFTEFPKIDRATASGLEGVRQLGALGNDQAVVDALFEIIEEATYQRNRALTLPGRFTPGRQRPLERGANGPEATGVQAAGQGAQ